MYRRTAKIMMRTAMCAVPLLATSCALPTRQPEDADVRPVPAERIFPLADQGPSTGNVVVTRDIGAINGMCAVGVMVDEKMAAHLNTAETVTFALKPGRHLMTATVLEASGLCALGVTKAAIARRRSIEILVDVDITRKYRLSYPTVDSSPVIEPAF
ncbi:hypothetical protein [Stenotrophomonas indicatrix]|uniref:hypothetical protein n=1 Tax=Stenotrophomonas indicatrix TaxID=2045451 RepID=UPI00215A4C9D|nr:hypothetical protein [Stenotrophomonas indicatrix]MCR8716272.1 hypothetical protein [Stenotrophomonas indicatrix]